jgi:hypothetical protein
MSVEESFVENLQRQSRERLQKLREEKLKKEKTTEFSQHFAFTI